MIRSVQNVEGKPRGWSAAAQASQPPTAPPAQPFSARQGIPTNLRGPRGRILPINSGSIWLYWYCKEAALVRTSAYLFSGLPLAMARPALRRALPKAAGSPGHEAHRRGPRHPLHPRWGRNRALNTARTRARNTRAPFFGGNPFFGRPRDGARNRLAGAPLLRLSFHRCLAGHKSSCWRSCCRSCWGQRSRRPPVRAVLVLLFLPNTSRGRPVPRAPPARPPGLTATYATARA
jgi:hypothetical protein